MLEVLLVDPAGNAITSAKLNGLRALVTADHQHVVGVFKAVSPTAQGTTIIAQPIAAGSVSLHDMLISSEKKQNGTLTISFTDGTKVEKIFGGKVNDGPLNLAISFKGKWRGWKDARVEVVMGGADFEATVALGYVRLPEGPIFAEWDDQR